MAAICQACGFDNPPDAVFCAECGTKIDKQAAKEQVERLQSKSGGSIPPQATPATAAATPVTQQPFSQSNETYARPAPMGEIIPPMKTARWYRSRRNRVIAGVSGGLSEYLNISAGLIRIIVFFVILLTGVWPGLIVYGALAVILPNNPQQAGLSRREVRQSRAGRVHK